MAAGGPCLLVSEQLDAVSVVSGRQSEVFDYVFARRFCELGAPCSGSCAPPSKTCSTAPRYARS